MRLIPGDGVGKTLPKGSRVKGAVKIYDFD